MEFLFRDSDRNNFGLFEIKSALYDVGAHDCDILFIHSDIMFGQPVGAFKKREYLDELYNVIEELGVKIIVPTFTFSFCNHEDYDIQNSRTSMGAFNDYVRKLEGRYRTEDPLLSVSVPSSFKERYICCGDNSLGYNSALDVLHRTDGVKFLFMGAEMADCFTYVHYVEKSLDVPYRFDMPFEGNIIYQDGRKVHKTQYIHTQCSGVKLLPKYLHFEKEMEEKGYLRKKRVGDKYVSCISEKYAYNEIKKHLEENIFYFLAEPYKDTDLVHRYTYSTDNGRITHC